MTFSQHHSATHDSATHGQNAANSPDKYGEQDIWRTAVIDIGSNSVRLVVYAGPERNPSIIFNEKVMAGLGRGLAQTGRIAEDSMDMARTALQRFALLAKEMQVNATICVATAAMRDAENGPQFSEEIRQMGLNPIILSGGEEARIAGLGVISGITNAHGIVGDLGGGSLDLAFVENGAVTQTLSLPLGVLRLAAMQQAIAEKAKKNDRKAIDKAMTAQIKAIISEHDWLKKGRKLPFYLVGGSWRAIARFDMHLKAHIMRLLHHYHMPCERPAEILDELLHWDRDELRSVSRLPNSRIDNLHDAAFLLDIMGKFCGSSEFIVSAYGLREGLLYDRMDAAVRGQDPLIVASRHLGRQLSRFDHDGEALNHWLLPIFPDIAPDNARWLETACHLADCAWSAHPDFRAERGVEIALHSNWVGIDINGRAMLAQALFTALGGGSKPYGDTIKLTGKAQLDEAIKWGLAIRLGLRLGAGTEHIYHRTQLAINDDHLTLYVPKGQEDIAGEVVMRRLSKLAQAMDKETQITTI